MSEAPRKFSFDTVFDAKGAVAYAAPRPKRLFPAEEVERIRAAAYAEGERTALASVAAQHAGALDQIAAICAQALPRLAEVAHEHRQTSAALSLACAKGIADAALTRFPQAPVQAAMEALAREIDAQPRLLVYAEPALAEALQGFLDEAARGIGYEGAVIVKPDGAFGPHAFILDFGDGQAAFDPVVAAERVNQALQAALAAEGLHAEPLIPGSES